MQVDCGTLAVRAHQPFITAGTQAGAQIEPARIGMIEQARMRQELIAGASCATGMRARTAATNAATHLVVKDRFAHRRLLRARFRVPRHGC